jgi:hypothetical protein
VCYHKNATQLYPEKWIEEYRNSILNQTYKEFDIYELEYSGGDYRIFENSIYHSKPFPSFVYALNYLLDCLFFMGYDCVLNTNVDDVYSLDRVEKQLPYIERGYDIVSSNFHLVDGNGNITRQTFDNLNLELELANNHNVIAHPAVVYSKRFWENNRYVPEQIPLEDMMLWQRAIKNSKFIILPDILLYHRIHSNSVCQSENR